MTTKKLSVITGHPAKTTPFADFCVYVGSKRIPIRKWREQLPEFEIYRQGNYINFDYTNDYLVEWLNDYISN